MKTHILLIIFTIFFATACTKLYNRKISSIDDISSDNLCQNIKNQYSALGSPAKMLLVQANGWSAFQAKAQIWEKNNLDQWEIINNAFPLVVGRNGMALGFNLARFASTLSAPIKKEGDGKTPVGLHLIGAKFGFESNYYNDTNYNQITPNTYCVDDTKSEFYNRVINLDEDTTIKPNWQSAEKMMSVDLYKIGAEINYKSNSEKAAGSCIFMHLWRNANKGTAGCIAASRANLESVLNVAKDESPLLIAIFPSQMFQKVKSCF